MLKLSDSHHGFRIKTTTTNLVKEYPKHIKGFRGFTYVPVNKKYCYHSPILNLSSCGENFGFLVNTKMIICNLPSNDYWCTIWIQSSFLFLRSLIYSVSHEVLLVKALFCGGIHTGFLMGTTIMHYIKGHPRNITAIFVVKMAYWFYIR